MLRLFLNKSLMLSPFRGSGFFHGNDVHVDHNTSVVLLFSIARGETLVKERLVVNCVCLCRLSSYGELLDSLRFQFRFAS